MVRIAVLLGVVGGISALLFVLATVALSTYFGVQPTRRFIAATVAEVPFIGNAARELRPADLSRVIEKYELMVSAGLGWLLAVVGGGVFRGNALAAVITRRFYRPYDDLVLPPVTRPKSHDGSATAMRWRNPEGSRLRAWESALTFLREGTLPQGASLRLRPPSPPVSFAWLLILGQPGAGKSRMAAELARLLGRRDLLGDPGSERSARWRLILGTWLRRRCPFFEPRPDDPWDAGLIDPLDSEQLELLRKWRPRRRTVLWLNDPSPGQSSEVLGLLEERQAADAFGHAVRLMISNQSYPLDLLARHRETTRHSVTLPSSAFSAGDIRVLAPILGQWAYKLYKNKDVAYLLKVTGGNPLLVELAFEGLRTGQPLQDITQRSLLDARVARIRQALETAGFPIHDMEAMRALACLTLAGPSCPIEPVNACFGNRLPSQPILAAAFPIESAAGVDLARIGPAIRPELIGDSFVRSVIAEQTPETSAQRISDAAFRARPVGWLRSVERAGSDGDALAAALSREPQIEPGDSVTRILIGTAIIRLALTGQREATEAIHRIVALAEGAERTAEVATELGRWFDAVVAADWQDRVDLRTRAAAHADELEDMEDAHQRLVHGRTMLLVGAALLALLRRHDRASESGTLLSALAEVEQFVDLVARAHRIGIFDWTSTDSESLVGWAPAPALPKRLKESDRTLLRERLAALYEQIPIMLADEILGCLGSSLATLEGAIPPPGGNYFVLQRNLAGISDSRSVMRTVREAAGSFGRNPKYAVEEMRCWSLLACIGSRLGRLSECRTAIAHLDSIATPSEALTRRTLARVRAVSRNHLIQASRADPKSVVAATEEVEEIASLPDWAGDSYIQAVRADCWAFVANSKAADPVRRRAVERARSIASVQAFRADRVIQSRYLESLYAYYRTAQRESDYETAFQEIARLATNPSYADDQDLQVVHTGALADLAYGAGYEPPRCRTTVARLIRLAECPYYRSNREIQFALLRGLDCLSFAWSADAAVTGEAARTADRVAALPQFRHDVEMQRLRLIVWSRHSQTLDTEPSAQIAAVERVDRLARNPLFEADIEAQLQRVISWQHYAFARRYDPPACRTGCEQVEMITSDYRYYTNLDMQRARAEAWKYLGFATRGTPECAIAVAKVDRAASALPNDEVMQGARAQAWRDLATSFAGDKAKQQACIHTLETIVAAARPDWSNYNEMVEYLMEARHDQSSPLLTAIKLRSPKRPRAPEP